MNNFIQSGFISKKSNIPDLTRETLEYWNSKDLKKHQIRESKMVDRLSVILSEGSKSHPNLFNIEEIKKSIDIYEKHLKLGYSKLSQGNGKVFLFNIDDFFKFSKFTYSRIESIPKYQKVIGRNKSLFFALLKKEDKFFYEKKKAGEDFNLMVSTIEKWHLKNNEDKLDEKNKISSGFKIEKCYNDNIKDLVLCDGIPSNYEVENRKIFATKECFFNWFFRFINEKLIGKFKINYLNSNFLYSDFLKWMHSIGRLV
jgi:hypothetical protein